MNESSMAYTILALAPFTHEMSTAWEKPSVFVESTDFSEAMAILKPSLCLSLPETLCPAGGIEIHFRSMKDFTPDGLLETQPFLADLFLAKSFLETAPGNHLKSDEILDQFRKWPHLPAINLQPQLQKETEHSESTAIDSILSMVALPDENNQLENVDGSGVLQVNSILQEILRIIFADSGFRTMEAAWRGLHVLLKQRKKDDAIRVEIVPTVQDNLEETLDNLMPALLMNPPSFVLVDCGFNSSSHSLELLVDLAEFGNTLLTPVLTWIEPQFFHIQQWKELEQLAYLPHYLDTPPFAKWKKLQKTPASRWLVLSCNHFLARYPYGVDNRTRKMSFTEGKALWIGPVWAIACLFVQGVQQYGWPVGLAMYQQRRIDNLALDMNQPAKPKAVEALLSDEKVDQLSKVGIISLRSLKDSVFITNDSMVCGNLSLSYQAVVSRFAQLVISSRDLLNEDTAPENLEQELLKKLNTLFEKQGTVGGEHLKVIAGQPDKDNKIPVQVHWHTPENLPLSGHDLRLDFLW